MPCTSMVFFPVFACTEPRSAKLQPRPDPQVALSRLALSSIPVSVSVIETLCFQTLAHSFPQRRSRNPFLFNRFRTLSIATGVYTPSLVSPLSLAAHKRTNCAILRTNCAPAPLFATLAQKHRGGGGRASVFLTKNFALALKSLLAHRHALFVRSFTKECFGTPLRPTRSTLFFKTAGCIGISNQILKQELVEDSDRVPERLGAGGTCAARRYEVTGESTRGDLRAAEKHSARSFDPKIPFSVNTDRQTSRFLANNLSRLVHRRHSLPEDLHEPRITNGECYGHG
jgi:hypothetical protein